MSVYQSVEQDERTIAVAGDSCRLVTFYFLLVLPIDYLYRAIVLHEHAWDLGALYIVGVAIGTIYQAHKKILGKTYWVIVAWVMAVTIVVSAITIPVVKVMNVNTAWSWVVTGVAIGITTAIVTARRQAR